MSFWREKKVLITGHTGFKGSWLALWLQVLGAEVIGFALSPPTRPNLFTLADVAAAMTSVIVDVRDYDEVLRLMLFHQPNIVFHLAAQPLVRHSYIEPIETYQTNVMGTVHVLEAARRVSSVSVMVNITTDKCYENQEWFWGYRETDRLGGHDPYSNSKACAELVTSAYRKSFYSQASIGLASARAGNVIGGGDWAVDRLVPDIMRACIHQTSIKIRNPQAIRPWQHVLDPLHGYLLLAEKLFKEPSNYSEGWNFGPHAEDIKSVRWIADYLTNCWGNEIHWDSISQDHDAVHEAMQLRLDCAKAHAKLAWQPRWNLQRALTETVQWYKAFEAKTDLKLFTLQQINQFMSEA